MLTMCEILRPRLKQSGAATLKAELEKWRDLARPEFSKFYSLSLRTLVINYMIVARQRVNKTTKCRINEAMAESETDIPLALLAKRVNLTKTDVWRLAHTLVNLGYRDSSDPLAYFTSFLYYWGRFGT